MWRQVKTLDDAAQFHLIMEQTDSDIYRYTTIKGRLDSQAATLLEALADEAQPMQAWVFEEKTSLAALRISKRQNIETGEWKGRIVTFCAVGFDADLYTNWKIAFPIINQMTRDLFDAWGVKDYFGDTPRTKNGEMLAYFASAFCWESTEAALSNDDQAYRIKMSRDEKIKPVDEEAHAKAKAAIVVPDTVPAAEIALPDLKPEIAIDLDPKPPK